MTVSDVKIRKGDTVELVSGSRDEIGKRGEVIRVLPKEGFVVISGVNIRKKHQKQMQTQGRNINPGIVEFEAPIHISNVMLVCPKCQQTARVGYQRQDGARVRVCKNCGEPID
jgi:large subunit ribosomal protein L24